LKGPDCSAFLQWALPQLNLRWRGFRKVRNQVCKRIRRRMQSLGLDDFAAYRDHVQHHPREWAVLDGFCRITISRFYRDRNVFRVLGERILPELAEQATQERRCVTCWSAGCASGEEAYTLRILWDLALAGTHPDVVLSVLGTDIDEAVLARASAGCYPRGSVTEMPSGWIDRCFDRRDDLLCVRPAYRRGVSFLCQDIRRDMPEGPFDLVLCRNLVLTYFEPSLQMQVMPNIAPRLRCGGYLVIGAHEALPAGMADFQPLPDCRQILQRRGSPASFDRAAPQVAPGRLIHVKENSRRARTVVPSHETSVIPSARVSMRCPSCSTSQP
jgi:chemotaxis protein methyltransferase CheR